MVLLWPVQVNPILKHPIEFYTATNKSIFCGVFFGIISELGESFSKLLSTTYSSLYLIMYFHKVLNKTAHFIPLY